MLQNAYFLAKIGADTAENERNVAEILPKTDNYPTDPTAHEVPVRGRGLHAQASRRARSVACCDYYELDWKNELKNDEVSKIINPEIFKHLAEISQLMISLQISRNPDIFAEFREIPTNLH